MTPLACHTLMAKSNAMRKAAKEKDVELKAVDQKLSVAENSLAFVL